MNSSSQSKSIRENSAAGQLRADGKPTFTLAHQRTHINLRILVSLLTQQIELSRAGLGRYHLR